MIPRIIFRLLQFSNLHLIVPLAILLKFIKIVTSLTLFNFLIILLSICIITGIIFLTYKKSPWVIVCLIHGLCFLSVDLMRFMTFKNRTDYFFLHHDFVDFIIALTAVAGILNRGTNDRLINFITICLHYWVIVIATTNRDVWMGLYSLADVMVIASSIMIRGIDKKALFNKIIDELKSEIICYACTKISDQLSIDRLVHIVKSVSLDSLIKNFNSFIAFVTAESDKSTIEYLTDINDLLVVVKNWISGTKPPKEIQYFLTALEMLPLTCCLVLVYCFNDPYMELNTIMVLLVLLCKEYYNIHVNFVISVDYLVKSQECITGHLDTVILSVNFVKTGVNTVNATIETVTNGIYRTIEITSDISYSIYSSTVSGVRNIIQYTKDNPYKVGFIGLLPLIGVVGYMGVNHYSSVSCVNQKKIENED
jgi:hypothetical protein